jgi:folate-binding protein YgfZ
MAELKLRHTSTDLISHQRTFDVRPHQISFKMKHLSGSFLRSSRSIASPRRYICHNCHFKKPSPTIRQANRHNSTTPIANIPNPPLSGFALLPNRRLIAINGPDAAHFLQGIITSNIGPSTPRSTGFYTSFLNATGRVLYDVFIYPHNINRNNSGEGWLIEVDANEADRLFKHLKRFKLRAKFELRLIAEGEMGVWSVWRDGLAGGDGWTKHTIGEVQSGVVEEGRIGCADLRAPGMGSRVILPRSEKPAVEDGVEETSEEAYRIRRYMKGVAEGQGEIIREGALPQESNIDFMGGIDYRKGCYVGQELTIRTHHTGVIRKRILPVIIYGKDEEEPKALEYRPGIGVELPPLETSIGRVEKRGRSAGKFLTGLGNIGLGLCRLEIMTDTLVQGEVGGYKEGDEFKLEWESGTGGPKSVKVKAFVPPWHLKK